MNLNQQTVLRMKHIEVTSLKKYYGTVKALDGVSFSVEKGQIFGLLGPNGAGKTTTIEILEGLRARDEGEVMVLGLDPWKHGYDLHKRIGVIPQGFTFFEKTTPAEAITYYADLFNVKADSEKILKAVLLEDSGDVLFDSLSGGQKQKMGLALSLVNTPELVFLDEPTTGLDPNARRAIWEVIRGLKVLGKTVILTTHYLDEAQQLSDQVAIMNYGKIVAIGTADQIIEEFGSGERLEIRSDRKLADYLKERTKLTVDYFEEKGIVSVQLSQKEDALLALNAAQKSGMSWDELQTRRDTLDDVFIKLVSRQVNELGEIQEDNHGNRPTGKRRE